MAILKIDISPPFWIIPEISGQIPEPRMLQTSVYNQNLNCIIIILLVLVLAVLCSCWCGRCRRRPRCCGHRHL